MAKIEGVPNLLVSEFPDQKAWIGRLLQPLNQSIGSMIGAMRNKITFVDNVYCNVKTFTVTHGVAVTNIQHNLAKIHGVSLIKTPDDPSTNYAVTAWHWWTGNNNNISIYVEFKGAGTTTGQIKIRIEGE